MFLRSLLLVLVLLPLKSFGTQAEWYMQYMALDTGVKKLGIFYDGELMVHNVYDVTKNPLKAGSILTLVQLTKGSQSSGGAITLAPSQDGKTVTVFTHSNDEKTMLISLSLGSDDPSVVCYNESGEQSASLPGSPKDVLNLVRVRTGEMCTDETKANKFLGIKLNEED